MNQKNRVMDTSGMDPFRSMFYLGMDRILPMICHAPSRENGKVLNLGAGSKIIPGAIPIDYPQWDADYEPIPYDTESCVLIHAYHFLEHIKDPIKVLRECQRVLVPGGVMNIVVPYYNASIAAMDLDHKHQFNEDTWKTLFSNQYYSKNHEGWSFRVHFNLICGIVERNLCLMTQLVKE
jgi:SAM-dependent methyltransferase